MLYNNHDIDIMYGLYIHIINFPIAETVQTKHTCEIPSSGLCFGLFCRNWNTFVTPLARLSSEAWH